MDPIEPVTKYLSEQGVLGFVILVLLLVIGVLWRKIGLQEKQIFELQEKRISEARQMQHVTQTSTATLEAILAATSRGGAS